MLRLAALLTATYLAAFLSTSALTAPDGLRTALDRLAGAAAHVVARPSGAPARARASGGLAAEPARGAPARLRKSSALPRLQGAHGPAPVFEASEIEATAPGRLAIRDADGRLLFLRDPAAGKTTIARGARLPRLLAEPTGDAPRLDVAPGSPPTEGDMPAADDETLAAGCESAVSPLARTVRATSGVLCLAAL